MLWAIFPIAAQFFHTSASYIQNYLVDSAYPKKRAGALIVSHWPYMVAAMFILFAIYGRLVFFLPLSNAIGLIAAGAINVIASVFYYHALQAGDTADVNIFSQLSPIISLILGFFILGEVVTLWQGVGFALIMVAIAIVALGSMPKGSSRKIDYRVAGLTLIAIFFSILSDVIYAYFLKGFTADFMLLARGFFFFELGSCLMILIFVICLPSWRKVTHSVFSGRKHSRNIVASAGDNIASLFGEIFYKYGLLVVPVVAMMTVVAKVTSLFVSLFYTIFVGRIFPKFISGKRITGKHIVQYLVAAVFIVAGLICMN
jgi:drug/metabolite transporter (DMT)-like permease